MKRKPTPQKAPRRKKARRHLSPLGFLVLLVLVFFLAFFISGGLAIFSPRTWQGFGDFLPRLSSRAPSIESVEESAPAVSERLTRLLFIRREVAARMEGRDYTKLRDIPDSLEQAIIAVEDRKFYRHIGLDPEGIMRASLVNLQYGEIQEGASTITQQLAKNLFLSHEQTFGRKGEEVLLALDLELNYEKDEILELYLNTIYYGSGFYGIDAASRGYFGKPPRELNLAECAMLAGLPNAPSLYSPYVDFKAAKKRQIVVLDAMKACGFVTEREAEDAKIKPLYLAN